MTDDRVVSVLKALRIMSDGALKAIDRENEDEWIAYFSGQRDAYANAIAMLESIAGSDHEQKGEKTRD